MSRHIQRVPWIIRKLTVWYRLFQDKDKPHYLPGIKATLGIFCALMACVGITAALLFALNKQRQRQRVAVGKPQYIKDTSMSNKYEAYGADDVDGRLGQNGMSPFFYVLTCCASLTLLIQPCLT